VLLTDPWIKVRVLRFSSAILMMHIFSISNRNVRNLWSHNNKNNVVYPQSRKFTFRFSIQASCKLQVATYCVSYSRTSQLKMIRVQWGRRAESLKAATPKLCC
jgi:hypothetical protein